MSRNFDFSQAANNGITVLPDLTLGLPSKGDVLSVKATAGGIVTTEFQPPGGGGVGTGYLPLSGGTMTGPLVLAANPTTGLQASTKSYVDNLSTVYLPLTGGNVTGPITQAGTPLTTKIYVDTAISGITATSLDAVKRTGDTMIGLLVLSGDPTAAKGAATKQYIDGLISTAGLPDAPSTGVTFGRKNGAWDGVLPLAGGTLTGPLLLNAAPTVASGAATKAYVDANSFTDAPSDASTYGRHANAWLAVAPLVSPSLSGTPLTPTASVDTNTTQIASTQFVLGQAANAIPLIEGVGTIGTSTRYARQDHIHPAAATRNLAKLQAQWVTGAIVANDTVYLAYDAPYNGTINSLTYFTGNGSFTVVIQIQGVNVTGLSAVTVSSATPASATATAANTFSAGQRITAVITGATGSPTDALLSLAVTWS